MIADATITIVDPFAACAALLDNVANGQNLIARNSLFFEGLSQSALHLPFLGPRDLHSDSVRDHAALDR